MAERILLIEDDERLAGMVSEYLGEAGFRVSVASAGRAGLERLASRMVQFVRDRPNRVAVCRVADIIDAAAASVRPLCQQKGVHLKVRSAAQGSVITADRDGVHTGCATYARSKTVPCAARALRCGALTRALP
mgnify:CR=1 FL=1